MIDDNARWISVSGGVGVDVGHFDRGAVGNWGEAYWRAEVFIADG